MSEFRENFFNSRIEKAFFFWYRKIFSIEELESSLVLKFVFGATILSHLVTFAAWNASSSTTRDAYESGTHLCWPYFQGCGEWLWMHALPHGYSQPTLYMVFLGLLLWSCYWIYRKDWVLAHMALMPSFLWHTMVTFVLTQSLTGNYDYYLFIFSFILLLIPEKEYFLRLSVVVFYFLSTAAKIHEAWVVGTYFSALKTGLPWFPREAIPFLTNFVIGMEMVGAWFLLSKYRILQKTVFAFFVFFHLYSSIIVGFRYPTIVLPTLIILFGPLYQYAPPPWRRKALAGCALMVLIFFAQSIPKFIPGDEKLTLEGNMYGLYMFESNHQCISTTKVTYVTGEEEEFRDESMSARDRCDPYRYWFRIQTLCKRDEGIDSIAWTFDHTINGGPFYRIVDEKDACALEYAPFRHNTWIRTSSDAPIIGYPVENAYI